MTRIDLGAARAALLIPGLRGKAAAYATLRALVCDHHPRLAVDALNKPLLLASVTVLYDQIAGEIAGGTFELASRVRLVTDDLQGLLACAALLMGLEDVLEDHRVELAHRDVELPPPLGGRAVIAPPPAPGPARLVPKSARLNRTRGDQQADAAERLKLRWHVVRYEVGAAAGLRPVFASLPAEIDLRLSRRMKRGELRVALAAPCRDGAYTIHSDENGRTSEGVPFRFRELAASDDVLAELDAIVAAIREHAVDIVVLPELCLDQPHLSALVTRLQAGRGHAAALVIAGSFHEPDGERVVNRAHVYDGRGARIWSQDKCTAYRVPADQAQALVPLGIHPDGGREGIDLASDLYILDGDFARLVTPICMDVFETGGVEHLLKGAGVTLILAPAMTARFEIFERRAMEYGDQLRTTTVVSNSGWLLGKMGRAPDDPLHGLVYLPARRGLVSEHGRKEPPLRLFDLGTLARALARLDRH